MAKIYTLRRIRNKRSYSFRDLADCLNVHIRTVQTWYKRGLPIIEDSQSPYLVMGADAKTFLKTLQNNRKTTLKEGECYCVACHKPVLPITPSIKKNKRRIGNGKESISIIGNCPHCDNKVTRFSSQILVPTTNKSPAQVDKKQETKEAKKPDNSINDLPLFRLSG